MSKYLRRVHREDEGFSLVELLIVIVVLGILGGIVVFGVANFRADSTQAACEANLKQVNVGSQAYRAKTGNVAADVDALVTAGYLESNPTAGSNTFTIAQANAAGPPVVKKGQALVNGNPAASGCVTS